MPTFEYKARSKEGEVRSGVIEASSEEAALDLLQQKNLIILSINKYSGTGWLRMQLPLGGGVTTKDVVIFSRQLAPLFEARIPVVQSLHTLITDIILPGMNGHQLASTLAKSHPNLKVLFMSGYTNEMVFRNVMKPGVAFLQKPFNPSDLCRKLEEIITA